MGPRESEREREREREWGREREREWVREWEWEREHEGVRRARKRESHSIRPEDVHDQLNYPRFPKIQDPKRQEEDNHYPHHSMVAVRSKMKYSWLKNTRYVIFYLSIGPSANVVDDGKSQEEISSLAGHHPMNRTMTPLYSAYSRQFWCFSRKRK